MGLSELQVISKSEVLLKTVVLNINTMSFAGAINVEHQSKMSHVMTKPDFAICEQQRRRSACASAQSDQRLCCLLPGQYNTSVCYSRTFKTLASLIS